MTIVDELGREIVTGEHRIGDVLPTEDELRNRFRASRTVLREATRMLTGKGLVLGRQRKGTVVQPETNWNLLDPDVLRWMLDREFTIDLLIEFTEMRMAIEPQAAALAAQSASGSQRHAIAVAMDRMRAAEEGRDDPLESDIAFHVAVMKASNNRFIQQLTGLSEVTLRLSIRQTNENKGVSRASTAEHGRIADAIMRGEVAEAQSRMEQLIRDALDLLLNADEQTPRRKRRNDK